MIKHFKIGRTNIALVFKYRFTKPKDKIDGIITNMTEWRSWKVGMWFSKDKIVGIRSFSRPKEWNRNLVGSYRIGFDLLIIKGWISWDIGGAHFKIKDI